MCIYTHYGPTVLKIINDTGDGRILFTSHPPSLPLSIVFAFILRHFPSFNFYSPDCVNNAPLTGGSKFRAIDIALVKPIKFPYYPWCLPSFDDPFRRFLFFFPSFLPSFLSFFFFFRFVGNTIRHVYVKNPLRMEINEGGIICKDDRSRLDFETGL